MAGHGHGHGHGQTDEQTDRETYRTDSQPDRQTDSQTDRQTGGQDEGFNASGSTGQCTSGSAGCVFAETRCNDSTVVGETRLIEALLAPDRMTLGG